MLLESFLSDRYALEKDLAKSTVTLYHSCVRCIESWASRPVLVSDLSDDFVNRWLVFLGTTGICKTTVANHRRFMLALWRHAFQDRLTDTPPLRVRKIQIPRTMPEAWSLDQMTRLLEACDRITGRDIPFGVKRGAYWRALILVAWSTGLRLGDIERIRREQIGSDGTLIIHQQKTSWPVLCRVSAEAMAAVDLIGHTTEKVIFGGRLSRGVMFSDFRTLAALAGLQGTSKKIRKSGATAVENAQPGSAKGFLGHQTHGLSYKHYVDPTKTGKDRPEPPRLTG
jgi:integrase